MERARKPRGTTPRIWTARSQPSGAGSRSHPGHNPLRLGLAAVLINAGQLARALTVYDALLRTAPRFAPAHVGRAILLHELGRPDDAERAFERAVEVARRPERFQRRLAEYRRLRRGTR